MHSMKIYCMQKNEKISRAFKTSVILQTCYFSLKSIKLGQVLLSKVVTLQISKSCGWYSRTVYIFIFLSILFKILTLLFIFVSKDYFKIISLLKGSIQKIVLTASLSIGNKTLTLNEKPSVDGRLRTKGQVGTILHFLCRHLTDPTDRLKMVEVSKFQLAECDVTSLM